MAGRFPFLIGDSALFDLQYRIGMPGSEDLLSMYFTDAEREYRRFFQENPEDPQLLLRMGCLESLAILSELNEQTQHVQSALGYLDKAMQLAQARSTYNPTLLQLQRAITLERARRWDEAMLAIQDAIALQEERSSLPIDQAEVEIVFGSRDVSQQNLRERLLDQMAETAERARQWDRALSVYEQQLAAGGIQLSSIAEQMNECRNKWMSLFEAEQSSDPAVSPLKAAIAESLERVGLLGAAEQWYRAALSRHPSYRLRSDELFDLDRLRPSPLTSKAHKSLARVLENSISEASVEGRMGQQRQMRAEAEVRLHRSIAKKLAPEVRRSPVNTRVYLISF